MSQLKTKLARLFISQEEARSIAYIYLPKITPLELGNFGQLFLIIEIDSLEEENKKIITIIQDEIKSAYYGSPYFTIEAALENALGRGNKKLRELITSGLKSWVEKFNAIVGVIKDRELHFTQVGRTNAFLIHQQKIINILENSAGSTANINPLKVFSNIISGVLSADDSVLFCTSSLLDYLSQEKLRRIISTSPPDQAVRELQSLLEEGTHETPFAAIILKQAYCQEEAMVPNKVTPAVPASDQPDRSMSELIAKEESTAEYLTPSVWPKVTKNVKSYFTAAQSFLQNKIPHTKISKIKTIKTEGKAEPIETAKHYAPTRGFVPQKQETLGKRVARGAKLGVAKLFQLSLITIKKIFSLFRSNKRTHGHIRTIPHKTSHGMASWLIRLKKTPLKQKIILGCATLLIFVFAYNIVNLGESKEKKAQKEQYVQDIAQAKELASKAKNALIYENEEEARRRLTEAKSLLNNIPSEEKNLQADKNNALLLIQNSLDTVNHVEKIADPNLIADLAQTNPQIDIKNIFLSSGSIYALDTNGIVTETNLKDQETKIVELSGVFEEKISTATQRDEKNFIVVDANNTFYKLDLENKAISKISVQSENTDQKIKALGTYLSRLYVLDTKNNQIFRHEQAGQGYAKDTAWLNEEIELKEANSLTIDGSVWLAMNNGEIIKLHAGSKADDFTFSTLDPAFSNPTVIKATTATDNLYILDPNNKRVVILKKDGSLAKQIYSEKFDYLKDLTLDENSSKIYLLNRNILYSAEI